jgi:ornithine carbamoyltransferase
VLDLAAEPRSTGNRAAGRTPAVLRAAVDPDEDLFSVAIAQLGGTPIQLMPAEMQLSRGESLEDTGRCSRYLDALAIRTPPTPSSRPGPRWRRSGDQRLTEVEHPCQALADALTIRERPRRPRRRPVAWATARTCSSSLAHPHVRRHGGRGRSPGRATSLRRALVRVVRDPREAARGADVLVTDIRSAWQEATRRSGQGPERTGSTRLVELGRRTRSSSTASAHPGEEISPGAPTDAPAVWDEARTVSTSRRCSRCHRLGCAATVRPEPAEPQRVRDDEEAESAIAAPATSGLR